MNSKFTTFLASLIIIPCILIFAGCNPVEQLEQKVNIDTGGNYQTSTAQATWDAISGADFSTLNTDKGNFRLQFDFSFQFDQNTTYTGKIACISKQNTDGSTHIASRIRLNTVVDEQTKEDVLTKYMILQPDSSQEKDKHYIDYSFAESGNKYATGKYDITEHSTIDNDRYILLQGTMDHVIMTITDCFMPNNETLPDSDHVWAVANTIFKLSTKDSTTKVQLNLPESQGNVFVVIQDNKFSGMLAQNASINYYGFNCKINGGIITNDQDVEFPDFAEYIVYTPPSE